MSKQTMPLPNNLPPSRWEKGFLGWLNRNKWTILVLFQAVLLFVAAALFIHNSKTPVHQATAEAGLFYDPAVIETIVSDDISVDPYTLDKIELGNQQMHVRLTSGKYAGHSVDVMNYVSAFNSRKMKDGEKIVLCIYTETHPSDSLQTITGKELIAAARTYGIDFPLSKINADQLTGLNWDESFHAERAEDLEGLTWAVIDGQPVPAYQAEGRQIAVFTNASVYSPNRLIPVIILVILFFLITTLVGGKTGVKSLLGLVITVICLIWIMCPLLMKGAPMIPTAFLICVYVAIVSFVFLGGVTKKTICAFIGTFAGMALAAAFGEIAQGIAKINSYNMYDVNSLIEEFKNIQTQGIPLHITGIISAGIIIASLGAVMDVAMSLSSSISELKAVNPQLGFKQLWKSGMNIGRDMVGTMTNTLILAFIGGDLVLMIWLWSLDLSLYQLLSSAFFSVELVSALSSSIGVILAVPLTALVAAAMHAKKQ